MVVQLFSTVNSQTIYYQELKQSHGEKRSVPYKAEIEEETHSTSPKKFYKEKTTLNLFIELHTVSIKKILEI